MVTWSKIKYSGRTKPDGTLIYYKEGDCLSSDTKPTEGVGNGSKLFEMNTGKLYAFDEKNAKWEDSL
jgi:hypothetical protein